MTNSDPRDRTAISDSRVDAAWRASSSEESPKSLDAAIMAAARREVGARPQKIATREAIADRRRWWPLAAAATVAAIAVGMLQLTPPDRVGAPATDKTIVSDVPAPASRPAPEMPTAPSRPEEAKPEAGNALRAEQAATRADSPRRQTSAPESRVPAKQESASEKTSAMAEPFPAAPPPTAVAVVPAPTPAPASALSAQGTQESASTQPAPLAKMAAGRTADARADEARAKDRGPLPVTEWIALIRRLRDEGKSADAAKELAAFRVAHADHEKLLPSDVRDWRP